MFVYIFFLALFKKRIAREKEKDYILLKIQCVSKTFAYKLVLCSVTKALYEPFV